MRILIAALALMASACTPMPGATTDPAAPTSSLSATDCAARGGSMKAVGRLQTMQCVIPYADAGKTCTDGDQCAGDCRIEDVTSRPAEGAAVSGRCQANSQPFGCFTRVEDGKAAATLCVD